MADGVLTNNFLRNVAQLIVDSKDTIAYQGFSESEQTLLNNMTDLTGEIGDRVELSPFRTDNVARFASQRDGSQVPEGEQVVIQSTAFFLESEGGNAKIVINLPPTQQTSNFDMVNSFDLEVLRNE